MQGDTSKSLIVWRRELGLKPLEDVGLLVSETADGIVMETFDRDGGLRGNVLVVFGEGESEGCFVGTLCKVGRDKCGAGTIGRCVESAEEFDGIMEVFGGALDFENASLGGSRGGIVVVFFFLGS